MSKEDSSPAFPRGIPGSDVAWDQEGMSLRQWFAGMAMQGLSANPKVIPMSATEMAEIAYEQADAMLKEGGRRG